MKLAGAVPRGMGPIFVFPDVFSISAVGNHPVSIGRLRLLAVSGALLGTTPKSRCQSNAENSVSQISASGSGTVELAECLQYRRNVS